MYLDICVSLSVWLSLFFIIWATLEDKSDKYLTGYLVNEAERRWRLLNTSSIKNEVNAANLRNMEIVLANLPVYNICILHPDL